VAEVWTRSSIRTTPADRALQWLWDQPAVTLVLSGMSSLEQVEQNLASAARSRPHRLPATERALYLHAKAAYEGLKPIPCTQCQYCQPCPNGVNVPRNLELYNDTVIYGHQEKTQRTYRLFFPADQHADRCQHCGECEPKCPQNLPIMNWLPQVEARLGTPVPRRVAGSPTPR
jgi:predicted aldo/keto reductase-like oxidoreductase